MNKTEQSKQAVIKALEQSLGIVTVACKSAKVCRTQFYEWLKTDEQFKKKVDDIENIALDFAESKLHGLINSGDTAATIFYLKSKGKKRGYIEKQQIEHEGSLTIHQITGMEIK